MRVTADGEGGADEGSRGFDGVDASLGTWSRPVGATRTLAGLFEGFELVHGALGEPIDPATVALGYANRLAEPDRPRADGTPGCRVEDPLGTLRARLARMVPGGLALGEEGRRRRGNGVMTTLRLDGLDVELRVAEDSEGCGATVRVRAVGVVGGVREERRLLPAGDDGWGRPILFAGGGEGRRAFEAGLRDLASVARDCPRAWRVTCGSTLAFGVARSHAREERLAGLAPGARRVCDHLVAAFQPSGSTGWQERAAFPTPSFEVVTEVESATLRAASALGRGRALKRLRALVVATGGAPELLEGLEG